MRSPSTEVVRVPFHGDVIEAVKTDDGKILVHFKRVCESLGVCYTSQLRKMREREWCEFVDLSTQGRGDQRRTLTMIDHESLPMWLATINPTNVRQETKPKLARYQREAKAVLAAWFLGKSSDRPDLAREFAELKERLAGVEARLAISNAAAWAAVEVSEESSGRVEALLRPFTKRAAESEFKTVRSFASGYEVVNPMGRTLTADESRAAGRFCKELSDRLGIPVVSVPGRFGATNAYRLDVLLYWRMSSDLQARLAAESYARLARRRLFV